VNELEAGELPSSAEEGWDCAVKKNMRSLLVRAADGGLVNSDNGG
jgi:hypothetical protein